MKLVDLEKYGRERGYTIEKVANKKYEWYRNDDHSMVGVCETIRETINEINADYERKGSIVVL